MNPEIEFVERVRQIVADRLEGPASYLPRSDMERLMPGKMLRTRLAGRLAESAFLPVDVSVLEHACAATEILHTASLCHDDVVDRGLIRGGQATLWTTTSPSEAVLMGDMLLCEAIRLLLDTGDIQHATAFIGKIKEVCEAETEQELDLRGLRLDKDTCLRVARGKTGPLFAFVCCVCGGRDKVLSSSLEEAGYRIGTAYQLIDDLLDITGDEADLAKTLGTDRIRGKFTLPQIPGRGCIRVHEHVSIWCGSALDCVDEYPDIRNGLERFLTLDLQPVLDMSSVSVQSC